MVNNHIKKNLIKAFIGFVVACLLLVFGTCGTAYAQSNDEPTNQELDTRVLNEIVWDIQNITPWILNYCDETAPAYSIFLMARQTALDISNNNKEATQQLIDEATENLRAAYLALSDTLNCKEEQVKNLKMDLLRSRTYIDMYIFTGIPLPLNITAASYNRMAEVRDYISWLSIRHSEVEELLGAVRMLQEAISAIEINNADYTALRAALWEQYDIDKVSWKYTLNSYERYANTCDIVYKEFGKIPTQEEADEMLARVEAAKKALVLKGDINSDGDVNLKDVINIQKHIAKMIKLEGASFEASDFNEDGLTNIADIIDIQKYLVRHMDSRF